MSAAEFEDEKEAQLAVLKTLEELDALQSAFGSSAESKVMKSIHMEMQGSSLAEKVESILTNPGQLMIPAKGASAATGPLPRVAVCGLAGGESIGQAVLARIQEEVAARGGQEPQWLDLAEAHGQTTTAMAALLAGCEVAVVCPSVSDGGSGDAALEGLRAVLAGAPDGLSRVVLMSRIGAQDTGGGGFDLGAIFGFGRASASPAAARRLEDELTSTARLRTARRAIHHAIIRVGPPRPAAAASRARCFADGAAVAQGPDAGTSQETAVEAVVQAMGLSVDLGFCIVDEPAPGRAAAATDWPELLLPFIGPEVWRAEVRDARRAGIFVQQWAEEFFGMNKNAVRFGVKTPLELRQTAAGVVMKFRPLATPNDVRFDDLDEGGLEFIAEEPAEGKARLRAKRCAYGWKIAIKEKSEEAILHKFKQDWAEVEASSR